jgi:hypothetical protein
VAALTTMLHSCGHDSFEWPKLYQQDPDFTTTYLLLSTHVNVTNFHIHDELLFHLGHLSVPTRECVKIIWEAHYSWMEGHFGMEKIVVILQKLFIGQNFDSTSVNILDIVLHMSFPNMTMCICGS